VMGMPLCQLGQALSALGYRPPRDLGQICQSYGRHVIAPWQGAVQGAA